MSARPFLARWFLIGGGALAATGLVLWLALPVRLPFPPYLATAFLALSYGVFCSRQGRAAPRAKS